MSLLGECLLPYMFVVLIRELNGSYLHDIMYSIHYFQLKNIPFCVVTITLTKISQIISNMKKEMCLQPPRIFWRIISSTLNELITYASNVSDTIKRQRHIIERSENLPEISTMEILCAFIHIP